MSDITKPPIGYGQLLRQNREFRLLGLGQIVSQLGDWFNLVVLQVLLLKLTGSPTVIAWHLVASMLPAFLVGPLAGVVVDRLPRKTVMILADLARAGIALGFLFVRSPETVWIAYLCAAGLSFCSTFFEPARTALIPNIVNDRELVTANALGAVTWSTLLTAGALLGGVVAFLFGTSVAFVLNALSFVVSAVILSRLRPLPPAESGQAAGVSGIVHGFRYVWGHATVGILIVVKSVLGLSNGIHVLIPIFGQQIYPLAGDVDGKLTISLLIAASGLGTALGPIWGRKIAGSDPRRMRWCVAGAFLWTGLFYVLLGYSPSLWWTILGLFLARQGGSLAWVFSTVLLQQATEDRFRGRVFAAEMSLFTMTMMCSGMGSAQVMVVWKLSPFTMMIYMGVILIVLGLLWSRRGLRAPNGGIPRRIGT